MTRAWVYIAGVAFVTALVIVVGLFPTLALADSGYVERLQERVCYGKSIPDALPIQNAAIDGLPKRLTLPQEAFPYTRRAYTGPCCGTNPDSGYPCKCDRRPYCPRGRGSCRCIKDRVCG